MGIVLCTRRISRHVKGKCAGRIGGRGTRIRDSRGIFSRNKERVWKRERIIGKSSRIEEAGARRKDDGRICSGV